MTDLYLKCNIELKWNNTDVSRNIGPEIMKYIFRFTKSYWSPIPNFMSFNHLQQIWLSFIYKLPFPAPCLLLYYQMLIFQLAYSRQPIQKQPTEVLCKKKGVLNNFVNFTGRYLCWILFLIKLQTCNLIRNRLQNRCFPVKFA